MLPPLFVTVIPVLLKLIVAVTSWFVFPVMVYVTFPVTGVLSIRVITTFVVPVFPTKSVIVTVSVVFAG